MIQSPELDDSQLALQIAFRTAFVSAVLFILLSVVFRSYPDSAIKSALEVVMKCAAVAVALLVARKKIISVKNLPESSHFVFLSTVFFYGITTIFVYLWQIVYLLIPAAQPASILAKFEFLLGVSSFSPNVIVGAFFASLLPYVVYYFLLLRETRIVYSSITADPTSRSRS